MISQAGMNDMATMAPMTVSVIFVNVGIIINTSKIVDRLPDGYAGKHISSNKGNHLTKPHFLLLLQ